jgi:LPPG:FO 2-phospho-L-lactate transferase
MGKSLSQITKELCHFWNLDHAILPVTDNYVPTIVDTDEGVLPFQEYFVKLQCRPKVKGFTFRDVEGSVPAPGVVDALQKSDIVIICPSNPWVSVDPILAIPGVMAALESSTAPIIAVSPIIGGEAVKGPAAKMFKEMGFQPSPLTVAEHYASRQAGGILDGFVLDEVDKDMELAIRDINMETLATGTWMKSISDRQRLAREVLEFGEQLMGRV